MPASSRSRSSRWLSLLLWVFAAAAAALWAVALLSPHRIAFPPGPSYVDITVYRGRFSLYHTARFFSSRAYSGFAYPAGAAVIYEAFYRSADAVSTYQIVAGIVVLVAAGISLYLLRAAGALPLALPLAIAASFPIVFLIQRANIELVLWAVVACGLLLAWRGLAIPAAICFGIGAVVKLYPILLLGLFLRRRRDLPAFAVGVLTALLAMGAAIAHAGPTFAIAARGFFTGVNRFQTHYVDAVSRVEVGFDHCFFSPFKYYATLHHLSPAAWRGTYYAVAGLVALLLFLRVRTLPFLNRALFLVAAMVSLPPVSFSYTLVHLELLLVLLLATLASRGRTPLSSRAAAVLLLAVMLPLPAMSAFGIRPTGPIASALLFLLLLTTALEPWPSAARGDTA